MKIDYQFLNVLRSVSINLFTANNVTYFSLPSSKTINFFLDTINELMISNLISKEACPISPKI